MEDIQALQAQVPCASLQNARLPPLLLHPTKPPDRLPNYNHRLRRLDRLATQIPQIDSSRQPAPIDQDRLRTGDPGNPLQRAPGLPARAHRVVPRLLRGEPVQDWFSEREMSAALTGSPVSRPSGMSRFRIAELRLLPWASSASERVTPPLSASCRTKSKLSASRAARAHAPLDAHAVRTHLARTKSRPYTKAARRLVVET